MRIPSETNFLRSHGQGPGPRRLASPRCSRAGDLRPKLVSEPRMPWPPEILAWLRGRAQTLGRPELARAGVADSAERQPAATTARGEGRVYTPSPLADRLAHRTLVPLLDGSPSPGVGPPIRILDPACGSGALLLAAFRALVRWGWPAASAVGGLYGQDIDPMALELCAARLAAASGEDPDRVRSRLTLHDALESPPVRPRGGGHFDAVLANPPWTSYSGRHRVAGVIPARTARRFPATRRWPSTHGMFTCLSARALGVGGRAGLLLPAGVADHRAHAGVRRELSRYTVLDGPPEPLGEHAFPGVTQPAVLVVLNRVARRPPDERRWLEPQCSPLAAPSIEEGSPPVPEIWAALPSDLHRFPDEAFFDPGVHTGNVAGKIVLAREEADDGCPLLREGRDVRPFALGSPRKRLCLDAELAPGEYRRVGPLDRYLEARILLRQTADRPVAARHVEPTYFRNSALGCRGVPGRPDAAVLALLNSATYAVLHRTATGDARQRTFPQVKVGALRRLPLPPPGPAWDRLAQLGAQAEAHPGAALGFELEATVLAALGLAGFDPAAIERAARHRPRGR